MNNSLPKYYIFSHLGLIVLLIASVFILQVASGTTLYGTITGRIFDYLDFYSPVQDLWFMELAVLTLIFAFPVFAFLKSKKENLFPHLFLSIPLLLLSFLANQNDWYGSSKGVEAFVNFIMPDMVGEVIMNILMFTPFAIFLIAGDGVWISYFVFVPLIFITQAILLLSLQVSRFARDKDNLKRTVLSSQGKKTFLLPLGIVILLLSFGLTYYFQLKMNNVEILKSKELQVKEISDPALETTNLPGIVYQNETFNFTLTFPDTWDGLYSNEWLGDDNVNNNLGGVVFGYGTESSIMVVTVLSKAQWIRVLDESGSAGTPAPDVLAMQNGLTYIYQVNQDSEYALKKDEVRTKIIPSFQQFSPEASY